jgi:lysophospholipase L1-like esterase
MAAASPRRQRFLTLALVAFAFAFALGVAELLARGLASAPSAPPSAAAPSKTDHPVLQRLSEIYNRKNVRGYWRGVFVRTNRFTLRGPDYASWPGAGVFRIAIGGDSFTMGLGVEEADTYPMQLERLLAADASAPTPQVLNVGLSGINLTQAVSRLAAAAGAYHPDLLVLGLTTNDIEGRYYRALRNGDVEKAVDASRKRFDASASQLLRLLWPRWISLREWVRPTPGSYLAELDFNYFENEAAWNDVLLGLDRFAALAKQDGVCGHVLIHTSLGELGWLHPEQRIHAKLEAAARERGLTVTQSFPYFRGRRAAELWVRAFDQHPNREGNALLARALYDGLHALPEDCWRVRH